MCDFIIYQVDDKNPRDKTGITPLHFAARNGHRSVCKLIRGKIADKNPATDIGLTPSMMHNRYLKNKKTRLNSPSF